MPSLDDIRVYLAGEFLGPQRILYYVLKLLFVVGFNSIDSNPPRNCLNKNNNNIVDSGRRYPSVTSPARVAISINIIDVKLFIQIIPIINKFMINNIVIVGISLVMNKQSNNLMQKRVHCLLLALYLFMYDTVSLNFIIVRIYYMNK